MNDGIQSRFHKQRGIRKLILRFGLLYAVCIDQPTQSSQTRGTMIDSQGSSYLTAKLVSRTSCEDTGDQDRRQEEQSILSDDSMG